MTKQLENCESDDLVSVGITHSELTGKPLFIPPTRKHSFKKESFHDGDLMTIQLAQEVSFLNKAAIKNTLRYIPENSKLVIDASNTNYIDFDVVELIKDFIHVQSKDKNIQLTLKGFKEHYNLDTIAFKHVIIEKNSSDN